MLIETPPNCVVALREPEGFSGTTYRQIRAHDVPVGYVVLRPGTVVVMIARCSPDILDAIRICVEKESGGPILRIDEPAYLVDGPEADQHQNDEPDEPILWLPESFT